MSKDELRRLYEAHSRGLLAYAVSIVDSFEASEDVVHKVFERLLHGRIEVEGSVVSYLYRAVRNASLNHIRDHHREVGMDNIEESWLVGPPAVNGVAMELQSALKALPEDQRETIVLHTWGGLSFEDIAAALEISPNTVASRYRYGLSKLRQLFHASHNPANSNSKR